MRDKRGGASFADTPRWVAALDTSLRLAWYTRNPEPEILNPES